MPSLEFDTWFRPADRPWRELHVVGTRSVDPEGRQSEIKKLKAGDPIELRLMPKKRGHPRMISVVAPSGVVVGSLKYHHAEAIAPALERGVRLEAISAVSPDPDAFLVGLWIKVRVAQCDD